MKKAKRKPARALTFWENLQPLVELYNLHLEFNPNASPPILPTDADKEKIKEYLRKHAPHVFLKDVEPSLFEMRAHPPKTFAYGTLHHFQKSEGREWFNSEFFIEFCDFCRTLCWLLDLYVDRGFCGKHLPRLQALLLEFEPTFMLRDRFTRELYDYSHFWDIPLDTQRYELVWGGGIVSTGKVTSRYKLNIGDLLARLTFSLYKIIADGVRVRRCARPRCKDVFIPRPGAPTGAKAPKYCPRCRSKRKI